MSNMSYCRFENTNSDLLDCQGALTELIEDGLGKLSEHELPAAISLVTKCNDILLLVTESMGIGMDEFEDADFKAWMKERNNDATEDE